MKDNIDDIKAQKIRTALVVGVVGGLFWSLVGYALYYMNFTKIGPSMFIQPFVTSSFLDKPIAHLIGVGVAGLLSVVFSMLYVFTLSKYYSPWIGIACGLALFGIVYYLLAVLVPVTTKPIHQLGMNTFVTELCLFVLYGLFVGFSLSSEYSSKEERAK